MVHLITGPIDSGKTTRMRQLYEALGKGDGFLLNKRMANGIHIGQTIERLSSGKVLNFSSKAGYIPVGWDECVRYCDYSFSKKGFAFAYSIISDILNNGIGPVFIDEIGPLELSRGGFYDLLRRCLDRETDLYLCVRDTCVDAVREAFEMKETEILNIYGKRW